MRKVMNRMGGLLIIALILFSMAHASQARFQGNLLHGLTGANICDGGSTVTIQLSQSRFREDLNITTLGKMFLQQETFIWISGIESMLKSGKFALSNQQKVLKVVLGRNPTCKSISDVEKVQLVIPREAIEDASTEILGPYFLVVPHEYSIEPLSNPLVVGNRLQVRLSGLNQTSSVFSATNIHFFEGRTCSGIVAKLAQTTTLSQSTIEFSPVQGGMISVCFAPLVTNPELFVKLGGELLIFGPEGISTDPLQPRAQTEFTLIIFGTNLTDQDFVTMSPDDCSSSAEDNEEERIDVALLSSSRSVVYVTLDVQGTFNVCYRRLGSTSNVIAGKVVVGRGGENILDKDLPQLLSTEDTLVTRPIHIGFLTLSSGNFVIDHYSLNVTHFIWTGGALLGSGVINAMGSNSRISTSGETRIIESVISNFGVMEVVVRNLVFSKKGVIHNFGKLTLLVNSTRVTDEAFITGSSSSHAVLINAPSGSITIRFLSSAGSLSVLGKILNHGSITVATAGTLSVQNYETYGGSTTMGVLSTVRFKEILLQNSVVTMGIKSVMEVDEVRHFRKVQFEGKGKLRLKEGVHWIEDLEVRGGVAVVILGTPMDSSDIRALGFMNFGSTTSVALKNAKISSQRITNINFKGQVVCHIHSVSFGDNIVIHSSLSIAMFGEGNEEAKLLPQRIPQNSSFVVPPNATLLLMNTGNRSQKELAKSGKSPRKCSTYLVIPINIEIQGKVLLWGCALFPFGGDIDGLIFGTQTSEIEATMKFAFCNSVLSGSDVCIPLFETDTHPSSALQLSGDFRMGGGIHSRPSMHLDFVSLSRGTLTATKTLSLVATESFKIDEGSSLILHSDGLVSSIISEIDGKLTIGPKSQLTLQGALVVRPTGVLRLGVEGGVCRYPLRVTEVAKLENSVLECAAMINDSSISSASFIDAGRITGSFHLDDQTCSSTHLSEPVRGKGTIGARFTAKNSLPSSNAKRISVGVVLLCITIMIIIVVLLRYSPREVLDDIRAAPQIIVELSWHEFSSHTSNFVACFSIMFDAWLLCCGGFHPELPLPTELHNFKTHSVTIMFPYSTVGHFGGLTVLCIIIACLWAVVWIPLTGKRASTYLKDLIHKRESPRERYAIQLFFQFCTVATVTLSFLYIPILSILGDAIACETILQGSPECTSSWILGPATLSFVLFMYLVPHSITSSSFPFGHPPYQRDLDIRSKRTFVFLQYFSYGVLVMLWKIFIHEPTLCVVSSFFICSILLLATKFMRPCAYENVNQFRKSILLFPMWGYAISLLQVYRHGAHALFVCNSSNILLVFSLMVGWLACLVLTVMSQRNCHASAELISNDGALASNLRCLREIQSKLDEYRTEMYNTASSRQRERVSENLSALRVQYLQTLNAYRRRKEVYLLPFYLGDDTAGDLICTSLQSQRESDIFEEAIEMDALDAEVANADFVLSGSQMENYIKGPHLGRGSYGSVHMGMISNGKLVAVKEIEISRNKKEHLDEVKREVDMLRSLVHTHVIRYYGCCTQGNTMRVFMEFAVGGSLTSLVRKFEKLTEAVMRLYTHQILSGLSYLHSENVAHRDIKGENILIDGHGVAKLADFGCSKSLADMANKSREGCGTLVGSPYWMAPEVIKNEAYGTKADIWSVGCTVVEMLNGGDSPWHEKFDNVYSAMFHIGNTSDAPSNIPDEISETCRDFLEKCFERDVSKRPSADDMLEHPWLKDVVTPHEANSHCSGKEANLDGTGSAFSNTDDDEDTLIRAMKQTNREPSETITDEENRGGETASSLERVSSTNS